MANAKYKVIFDDLIKNHQEEFDLLQSQAILYNQQKSKYKEVFKETQRQILLLVRKAENRLCSKTENTRFSDFSTSLAEKFWEEVRLKYPEVDLE